MNGKVENLYVIEFNEICLYLELSNVADTHTQIKKNIIMHSTVEMHVSVIEQTFLHRT